MAIRELDSVPSFDDSIGQLLQRTREFAKAIVAFVGTLPDSQPAKTLGGQVLYNGSIIGAFCARASRSSTRHQARECLNGAFSRCVDVTYWLRLLADCNFTQQDVIGPLVEHADELTHVVAAILESLKRK
jgi:four helix bundle protein